MYFYSQTFLFFSGEKEKTQTKIKDLLQEFFILKKKKKKEKSCPSVMDESSGFLYEYIRVKNDA